jgi:hypothetical protein
MESERTNLRRSKVKLAEIYLIELDELTKILCSTLERARFIKGLAIFQQVPSIGYKLALNMVKDLEIYSLDEMKDKNAADLFDRLENNLRFRTDSCVEDQIRCLIYYANNPNSNKQWYDFTEERKMYRQTVGYPKSRPKSH